MNEDNNDLVPQGKSLFPVSAEDIIDNALQNLDERQAKEVNKKAADEVVKLAVEKRKAEYRSDRAQEEMRNLINNANLLDQKVDDFKINSTFETATGTTSVEIKKSRINNLLIICAVAVFILVLVMVILGKLL